MRSWRRSYYRNSKAIGYLVLFGFVRGPQVEGKEVVPQLMEEHYTYYFPDYTVLGPIRHSMKIGENTTRTLRRVFG